MAKKVVKLEKKVQDIEVELEGENIQVSMEDGHILVLRVDLDEEIGRTRSDNISHASTGGNKRLEGYPKKMFVGLNVWSKR